MKEELRMGTRVAGKRKDLPPSLRDPEPRMRGECYESSFTLACS